MVDNSANEDRAVEAYYKEPSAEERREIAIEAFIKAAQGDLTAEAPFNYGHKNATAFDMMFHSLNTKGGVTLSTVFAYLAKAAKEDDEAMAILEAMADQFYWITS